MARVARQRCWVHKTPNILDKMSKSVQGKAKQLIHVLPSTPISPPIWEIGDAGFATRLPVCSQDGSTNALPFRSRVI